MRLYLIRHGLTLPQGSDSHEWPLSPEGEKQAEELANAPFWNRISYLYSSPEEKTLATVRPASETHDLTIIPDQRLREARRPAIWYEDYDDVARRYLEGADDSPEGWEDASEVKRRIEECFSDLHLRHPNECIAVCSHGLAPVLYLSGLPSVERGIFDLWRSIGFCEVAVLENGDIARWFGNPSDVL